MRRAFSLACLCLAACNPAPKNNDEAVEKNVAPGSKEPTGTPSAATAAPMAAETAAAAPTIAVLSASGIALRDAQGERERFAFGAARGAVDAAAARALGRPAAESANAECGAGPTQFSKIGPLTLNYQDGKLIGWLADRGAGVATVDGIRPGVSIAELKRERPVERLDTTLDGEFEYAAAGGSTIGGFADGPGDLASISSLYAGTNCFFR